MKNAIILAIGNELVEGIIVDTNSKYVANKLLDYGFKIIAIKTLPDDLEILVPEIKESLDKADLVVTTGGLGPTNDDLTREAISLATGKKLIYNEKLGEKILKKAEEYYKEVPENVKRQGYIFEGAIVIENPVGTAPGQLLKLGNKTIIILPGPPTELQPIFQKILKYLEKDNPIYVRRIKTIGIPEAVLVEKYKKIIYSRPDITVATMASYKSGVELRFSGKYSLKNEIDKIVQKLLEKISEYVYAIDEKNIEEVLFEKLKMLGKTVSFAESCTGGLVSSIFVNVPGISKVFKGAIVAYSNEIKEKILNVKKETLQQFGAVSKECVMEMAKGVSSLFSTDYSIAISGIAGPTGGSKEKPVGTVWICAYKLESNEYLYEKFLFKGNREIIRYKAVLHSFNLLRRLIHEEKKKNNN
ncbi:competence/damage-inducible protein A [Thermosipho atlanticus]|uniref:CinA-like protein n=1 Tax=Thermosipho atlanticus DSM 15807 TaxID=1123380 RepID=A0A1M5TN03_9BACT|nr:competence/damage-inducible protein A [Thermosipho atlanticus]SHH52041.1 competence/damage-inducible protein cinA [Thermosipho atlanticus DSM 15807]